METLEAPVYNITIEHYRHLVREVITYYAQFKPAHGEYETELIFDEANDHYELARNGWNGPHRIEGSVIHIDIRGGKIWIQRNGVEDGIANILVEKGVPCEHIVLAFKSPDLRPYTGFAVA